jgi:ribose-phosphate pyrophosphokinase
MRYLNLTEGFNPLAAPSGQEVQFDFLTFAGGEPHIRIKDTSGMFEADDGLVTITARINSFNDFGEIAITRDALAGIDTVLGVDLFIPYFPGGRQDRVVNYGESETIYVYSDFINRMGFRTVSFLDPHSIVTTTRVNYPNPISNLEFIRRILDVYLEDETFLYLVSPDAGASHKTHELAMGLQSSKVIDVIQCLKERDKLTGKLKSFQVFSDDLKGVPCLVVDDICDGGGTFLGIAEELKKKGAGDLFLAVTHGIFSKRAGERLRKVYQHVIATDSIRNETNGVLTIPINSFIV